MYSFTFYTFIIPLVWKINGYWCKIFRSILQMYTIVVFFVFARLNLVHYVWPSARPIMKRTHESLEKNNDDWEKRELN